MTQKTLSGQYEIKLQKQIIKLCHQIELNLHDNHLGPKIFTNYQRIALIVLFHRSGKVLRRFVDELVESRWPTLLGLKQLPSKSVLHDWVKQFDLSFVRNLISEFLAGEQPSLMAIDATGVDSWQRSRHYENRRNEFRKAKGLRAEKMPYAKVDLLVDTQTLAIHDFVLRTKPRHDTLGAKTMLRRARHKGVLILGDKGYDSEPLHELAREHSMEFHAPVRDFKVKRPKGRFRRQAEKNPPPEATRRCLVETTIRVLKTRFRNLRSRLHYMKKRELAWIVIVHNMDRLASQSLKALLDLLSMAAFWTELL
jgi:hypothetical protein